MATQTVTLHLPEDIYRRLQYVARATRKPLEDIVFQTIQGNLPPSMDDLPLELQDESTSLQNLSDEALWSIVRGTLP